MKPIPFKMKGTEYALTVKIATYPEGNLAIKLYQESFGQLVFWDSLTVNLGGLRAKDCRLYQHQNHWQAVSCLDQAQRFRRAHRASTAGRRNRICGIHLQHSKTEKTGSGRVHLLFPPVEWRAWQTVYAVVYRPAPAGKTHTRISLHRLQRLAPFRGFL